MIIREAAIDDPDRLAPLFDSYRQFYHKQSDISGAIEFLNARMTRNESVIFVAEENQKIVGFAQLYPLFSSTRLKRLWLLNDLFVMEEFRGKGISKLLIEKCFELAGKTKASGVMLETERSNIIGNKLYQQMGFKLIENNFYFHENISEG
ncbi:MAG TPA: GNAT family N-acetyltransferase [Chitinophagales bacterium]|nr:GNAT family N-acetyltransferase [Chitinophagales bacterium]